MPGVRPTIIITTIQAMDSWILIPLTTTGGTIVTGVIASEIVLPIMLGATTMPGVIITIWVGETTITGIIITINGKVALEVWVESLVPTL